MRFFVVVLFAVWALVGTPASVAAQSEAPQKLSEVLPRLVLDTYIDEFNTLNSFFSLDLSPGQILGSIRDRAATPIQIITLAGNQLSSFPFGSPSGGFTWTFDTASAAVTRSSDSFGPIFAERPITIGRRRLNVGTNYQHVTFDRLEGRRLRGGEIVSYFGVSFGTVGVFFEDALDVTVTTDTLNAFATYGLTDRLDIGIAVPFNRVDLRATLTSRVGSTVTGVAGDLPPFVTSRSGTASGFGDIVIRAKYNILKGGSVSIAESVDVRLPTGDELDLLGIAGPQVKLTFIASSAWERLSPHVNFAYTISGSSEAADDLDTFVNAPPEEINYAGGADLALSLRTTVAVDAVGRVLRRIGALTWAPSEFGAQFSEFHLDPDKDQHLLFGSIGVKVNPFGNMLLTTNVLFPLTKSGLTDNLTWMAGFDYSF